ncbi:hypothetical protein [Streptomyces sp. 43Y-GA-1]|uniref:hypothetical protein n=1 Tax=Streptomyces sp. 43Y-GA-1 TaxID=2939435 RepID=UPI0020C0B896|nr:hypothetical protein [Streptomyces sp. 43Y-GA-1]MCL6288144.1 hypothetical protein [Streptomyces sp. 43Y-GA-1]
MSFHRTSVHPCAGPPLTGTAYATGTGRFTVGPDDTLVPDDALVPAGSGLR